MVDLFLSYLRNEKRLSSHTLKAYSADLLQIENFLNIQEVTLNLINATYQDLRAWIVFLSNSGLENKSINRKMATVRSFYKWLKLKEKIKQDPSQHLKALKTPKLLPVYVEEKLMENLFECINFGSDFNGFRDKLIFELLYGTGIRLSELISLKSKDVDKVGKKITVLGKRGKYRVIPISDIVLEGELPKQIKEAAEMYAGCVAGAIQKQVYLELIAANGFKNISVQKDKAIIIPDDILSQYL